MNPLTAFACSFGLFIFSVFIGGIWLWREETIEAAKDAETFASLRDEYDLRENQTHE